MGIFRRTRTTHILDSTRVIETIERLQSRVSERFPGSGLSKVCADLAVTARATAQRARALHAPNFTLRFLAAIVVIAGVAAQLYLAHLIDWNSVFRRADAVSITQGLDASVNLLLLAFGAIWFVLTLELRLKRRAVLHYLHELRSFAHVVDMHQLTKDPTVILSGSAPTPSSPQRRMTQFELSRYLDYCAEMLALISKLAALYAGRTLDAAIISAVTEVEDLTSDLGRKIWQKIMILNQLEERRDGEGAGRA
jgi:hypothetical protein